MKVVDLEVIVKVKVEAVYEHEATTKKVEDLIERYGMEILKEPSILFIKAINGDDK